MLPTEQNEFFAVVSEALGAYMKFPGQPELAAWWRECKNLTLDGLRVALKSHKDDPDRGERAPRPADITRRLKTGNRDGQRCSARDYAGNCDYPGIFSNGTGGEGPWYCPWHRMDSIGPEASRWIEVSRDVPFAEASAKRIARMASDATRTAPVVSTAHAIARRHGNRPWQQRASFDLPDNLRHESEGL